MLTEKQVSASEERVKFVGVKAYVDAGGILQRDLFDDEHEGYLSDPALLDRLVKERCEKLVEDLLAPLHAPRERGASRVCRPLIPNRECQLAYCLFFDFCRVLHWYSPGAIPTFS